MQNENKVLPLIPLRGITIFPYMVLHFDVGRQKSILALEEAMLNGQEIFLASQKNAKIEEPSEDDIYKTGSICNIKQILKLPGNTIRVLVEGIKRARLDKWVSKEPFFKVEVEILEEVEEEKSKKCEALLRKAKSTFDEYMRLSGNISPEVFVTIDDMSSAGRLADVISSYLVLKGNKKQELLESYDPLKRLEKVIIFLKNETDILKLEQKIGNTVKSKIDKSQKEYYLKEQIKAIEEELGEDDEEKREITSYKSKITKAKLPKEAKEKALYELERLKGIGSFSAEGSVIRTYLDLMLSIPWNTQTKDNTDINKAKEILEKDHYGLKDVKERIIEYLAVRQVSKSLKSPIICLVGPPGVGKTSIAKSIAHALNKKFVRMSLGGLRDEAEIRGHRRTYVGAMPGRIIYGIKHAKSRNPVFLLDEIDKMSNDFRGDPADALLEVLDSEQNSTFRDHYLEVEFDLSKVLFITTANTLETIPSPLLDRMEVIDISGYTSIEKFHIAKEHLIPKLFEEYNVKKDEIEFSDPSIYCIMNNYTRESGVRSLERKIATIIRKSITEILKGKKKKVSVTVSLVKKYLGPFIFTYDKASKEDKVGVVTGMAWTGYGGDTLNIEVTTMPGTGKLQLTGQLGDVMQESAKTGFSLVRANAAKYNIDSSFYKKKDIHLHVPEGAVPKDGPSAGVTMVTALVSALSGMKVKHNVAMTGEVTLTGRVLPIGGLKEKSLAAYRAGIDTIILPKENERDMHEIPDILKKKMKFIFASKIDDVLENALIKETKDGN